jgi:hypothetical protein
MGYSRVGLISDDGSLLSIYPNGALNVRDSLKSIWGCTNVAVGLTAMLVVSSDTNRKELLLTNKGTSSIWLGCTPTVSAGITGFNYDALTAGSKLDINNFTGEIYAILGAGVSGNLQMLGVGSFS